MFSAPALTATIDALGAGMHRLLLDGRDAADYRLRALRREDPEAWRHFEARTLANIARDAMVGSMRDAIHTVEGARCVEVDGVTLFVVNHFAMVIKRHRRGDAVSNYMTRAVRARLAAGSVTLDTMETPTLLTAGYRWDDTLQQMGAAVVSFRRELSQPIWVAELKREAGSRTIGWLESTPAAPEFDLSALVDERSDRELER